MISFSYYDDKLKRCAKEIEVSFFQIQKLQHELSSYIETNAELQFQLSTLKFLEQQAEHEYHKIEEFNDAKEKEKQEILNKLNKALKDLKDQQDLNHNQQLKIKELEESIQECNEKLLKEQNQRETWRKEIEFFQNENRVLKQINEEKGTIKISRELSSESPSQDNVRKITQLERLQFEINDWKEKYFNEKKERERQTVDHQDLVIKKLKEQEEYQVTIRQWQTKYDQLNKQIDEKEEMLEEKSKEINYLQQKMYQIKDQQNQEIQTEDQYINSNQNSVSINVALVDEYDEQIIKTFKIIQNSKIENIQDFCQSKELDEENPLKLEISRIIKDAIHKLPRYAEVQIFKLEQHIEYLEKQVSYIHQKWKQATEENRRNSVSKVKVKKTQSHSLPDLEIPQDLCQINDEKLKELIQTLRNKQTQLKTKISLLQAQIQIQDVEKQDLLAQLEKKDKEQAQQLQLCQRQLTKHQNDYEKLHAEYQKCQSLKNRLKEKNNEMITDMAEFSKQVGVKNEIIADYKIKLEEVVFMHVLLSKKEMKFVYRKWKGLKKKQNQRNRIFDSLSKKQKPRNKRLNKRNKQQRIWNERTLKEKSKYQHSRSSQKEYNKTKLKINIIEIFLLIIIIMSAQRRGSAERKSAKRLSQLDMKFKESKFNIASKQNINLKKPQDHPYQRASNRKISQISQISSRKHSQGSVKDLQKRKESLMMEFKDILQNDISDFSDSSDSDVESKQSQSHKNVELKYSKHKPNELEQVSMVKSKVVSKGVITLGSIKESSHMKETFKSIKRMQSNKSLAQESHKRMRINSNISNDMVSMQSQRSQKRNLEYAHLQRMIEQSNIQEDERRKYQKLLDELERNCDEQEVSQRERVRKKVRQTFVKLFNQKTLKQSGKTDQEKHKNSDDSSSHMYNESVYINKSNINGRHSVGDAVTSILENQLVKKKLDDKLIKNFMQEFVQNDSYLTGQESDDQYDEQEDSQLIESEEEMNDHEMELLKEPTAIVLKNEVKKYTSKYRRDPNIDYYPLEWIAIQNIKWIFNELFHHYDNLPFLKLRMFFITLVRTVNFVANKIINHNIFVLAVLASIIYNIIVFLEEFESDGTEGDAFKEKKLQNIIKLLGYGFFSFFSNFWNIFDTIILALFITNYYYDNVLLIDFSTMRIFRILLFMSIYIKKLQLMLIALSKSVKFLIETLIIIILFTTFFALVGMHLFNGLFRLRCFDELTNEATEEVCGYAQKCEHGQYCGYTEHNHKVPEHFDNLLYAYGTVVRVMVFNDWTEPVYSTMRTFHPAIVIYYILLAFILGIFGVNLIIAVEKVYYSQTMHKYLHEDHQIEAEDQEDRINLRLLKYYGIDKLYKQVFFRAHNNTEFSEQNQKRNTIRKINMKKKKQYLSARQFREYEESVRVSLGLKSEKGKLASFLDKISFENLFMRQTLNREFWIQINQNSEFQQDEQRYAMIQKFQQNPFLSWQVIIKNNTEYYSSSEVDVFTDQSKNQQKMQRRQRELEFVSKMNPKQYYVVQQKDIDVQKKVYRNQLTYQSTKVFNQINCRLPILRRNKTKPRQIKVHKAENSLYPAQLDNIIQKRQDYNDVSAELNGVVNGVLFVNGQEQNYKSVRQLIKKVIKERENSDENAFEELYIMFRKEECKQNAIVKHNWSGDDVKKQSMEDKVKLFKNLNKVDKVIWVSGISGRYKVLQKNFVLLLGKQSVSTFFDLIVLLNVLLLCLEDLINSPIIEQLNDACNIFLVIEIFVKMISVGLIKYCQKFQNIFDFFFVSLIVAEVVIRFLVEDYSNLQTYLNIMRACQGILFYRVIKYYKFAVEMATISLKAFPSFFNLIILMVFVILVFALLGMDLFKDQFPEDIELAQQTAFDNLPKAFMVVFARSTMEDWYGLVLASTTYSDHPNLSLIYCILLIHFTFLLTVGFVIAIILEGFSEYQIHNDEDDKILEVKQINTEISENIKGIANDGISLNTQQDDYISESLQEGSQHFGSSSKFLQSNKFELQEYAYQKDQKKLLDLQGNLNKLVDRFYKEFQFFNNEESIYSLFIFDQKNIFRRGIYRVIKFEIYGLFINTVILISLFNYAIQTFYDHEDDPNNIKQYIYLVEFVMNSVVLVDILFKIIAYGFCMDNGAFTSETWTVIDFIYVVCFMAYEVRPYSAFYTIGFIKYLRPMRFVNMFKQLKTLNDALAKSIVDLINVLILQMMVWFVFALFGVQIYKNQMGYCEDYMEFHVNYEDCHHEGKEWITYKDNFDNIFNAMATIYTICTCDFWVEVFQVCFNSNPPEIGPAPLANAWITYIYFFLLVLVCVLFFMGFFMGILFAAFQQNRTLLSKQLLTQEQLLFQQVTDVILKEKPQYSDPPQSWLRLLASDIIQNSLYKKIMVPTLIANILALSMQYYESPDHYNELLNDIYYGISGILILDTILKLMSYGPVRYWGYSWRKLELILSLISLIDIIANRVLNWVELYHQSTIHDSYFIYIRLFYAFRNVRCLLLIQEFKGLSRLLRVLQFSAPYLFQIFTLYLAVLFSFAFAGCELFGQIDKGKIIDDYLNFTSFPKSLILLFKASTKNGWKIIMLDCTHENPYCEEDPKYCGQNWYLVHAYFYSYVLISCFIVLNLFVASLVDQFEKFFHSQNSVLQTYIENIDLFRTVWCKYSADTKGTKMHTRHLAHLLLELGAPLGAQKGDNIWDAANSASNFKIKADEWGYVHFQEVLYETVRYAYKDQIFKAGSEESILAIKQFDKETRYKLHYKRLNILERRQPIQAQLLLKGNFNILQEYIYLLTVFKTWQGYTYKLYARMKKEQYKIEQMMESEPSNFTESKNSKQSKHSIKSDLSAKIIQKDQQILKQHYITQSSFEEDNLPRYHSQNKKSRPKLKFIDQTQGVDYEINAIYVPQDPVNPQAPYDQPMRQNQRLKSAMKQQMKLNIGEDSQFQALSNESAISSAVKDPMNDFEASSKSSPQNIEGDTRKSKKFQFQNQDELSYQSLRSEDFGTEHHLFQTRFLSYKLRSGLKY